MSEYAQNFVPLKEPWTGRVDSSRQERLHQIVRPVRVDRLPDSLDQTAVFLGFACDEGIVRNHGRPGAHAGPHFLRRFLANLALHRDQQQFFDLGDVICIGNDLESAQKALAHLVDAVLRRGGLPVVFGGGHETAWGHYLGLSQAVRGKRVGIVNIDAHFDLRPSNSGLGTSGTPFRQIADFCGQTGDVFDYTVIGIQPLANTASLFQTARAVDCHFVTAEEIHCNGIARAQELVQQVVQRSDYLYLTICLDAFAAHCAPGVSAPQPLGLEPWQAIPLLRTIATSKKLIAFDVVELSPRWDLENRTARLAASLVADILAVHLT